MQGTRSWDALLVWLRRAHHNRVPSFASGPGVADSFDARVAAQVAELFEFMRVHPGSPWKRVKAVLAAKKNMGKLGKRVLPWVDDLEGERNSRS